MQKFAMEKLRLDKKSLRKFGITICIVFLVMGLIAIIRDRNASLPIYISIIFLVPAIIMPVLLKPVYILWIRFAYLLSWINTRSILIIIFYLIFAPIGIVMRLFGIDLLDRKIDDKKNSFWKEKEKRELGPLDYERQF